MTILAMTALLIGALLGLRFQVSILVPAIVIGSAVIFSLDMAHSHSLLPTLLTTVLAITALQIGYVGGAVIRFVIVEARVRKDTAATIAVAQRPPF